MNALLKWYDNDEDTKPIFVALGAIVGVETGDIGSRDEWLQLRLANSTIVLTSHKDTIQRFWDQWEIV